MKVIKRGSAGHSVRLCQTHLTRWGFTIEHIDGIFGDETTSAVEQFQAAQDLKVDGVVGPRTWSLLLSTPVQIDEPLAIKEQREWMIDQIPPTCHPSARSVLEQAISTLGWKEYPDRPNTGPELHVMTDNWYDAVTIARLGYPPWCALAVCWWLMQGLKVDSYRKIPMKKRMGGAMDIEDWGRRTGRFSASTRQMVVPPGAIFTMGRGNSGSDKANGPRYGHTGLTVLDTGPKVLTIDGNVSNQVMARYRDKTALRGFIRWW